jgi:hypothetical protein
MNPAAAWWLSCVAGRRKALAYYTDFADEVDEDAAVHP